MGSASELVAAFQNLMSRGGPQNITQPGRLVSRNPPVVEVNGVRIKKRVHINPAIRTKADLAPIADAMETVLEKFAELEEVKDAEPPEIVEAVMELAQPLHDCFEEIRGFLEKGLVNPGDQIMVRQDGNDIHVMTGTGV